MRRLMCVVAVALLAGCSSGASVEEPLLAAAPAAPAFGPVPVVSERAYAAIVVDAETGTILHESAAGELRYPASLTKMMTLYLLFDALDSGRLSTASSLTVSAEAAARPPAKLGVRAGTSITVDTAARALAVRSANDVAVVVAENLAGSESAFANAMTRQARALGMTRTTFVNASGLPDTRQVTTARDMAILGRALSQRFPRWFSYFSTRSVSFGGRTWTNTNKLLTKVDGMNGIKTGYIRASGYNLVASVERGGQHVIAVVLGGRSGSARNARMVELIDTYLPRASGGRIAFASR